jgi:hypothetical protein
LYKKERQRGDQSGAKFDSSPHCHEPLVLGFRARRCLEVPA